MDWGNPLWEIPGTVHLPAMWETWQNMAHMEKLGAGGCHNFTHSSSHWNNWSPHRPRTLWTERLSLTWGRCHPDHLRCDQRVWNMILINESPAWSDPIRLLTMSIFEGGVNFLWFVASWSIYLRLRREVSGWGRGEVKKRGVRGVVG